MKKYLLSFYIALGLVLSCVICIEYHCSGEEVFPTFYGSPFIYKRTSLASSMEYFYSISGLAVDVLIWWTILLMIHSGIYSVLSKITRSRIPDISYKIIVGLFMLFASLNIFSDFMMLGRGFDKTKNYWDWNVDREAKAWVMDCQGRWTFFYQ